MMAVLRAPCLRSGNSHSADMAYWLWYYELGHHKDDTHIDFVSSIGTWWRSQMETFSALLVLCAGNSSVTGEFPSQRPVTRNFGVSFDLRLNKRLRKQQGDLRRHRAHYDGIVMKYHSLTPYLRQWSPSKHWGRVTRICAGKLTIIGSDNGLSLGRGQAIIWTIATIFSTNFSEKLRAIHTLSFKENVVWKMAATFVSASMCLSVISLFIT